MEEQAKNYVIENNSVTGEKVYRPKGGEKAEKTMIMTNAEIDALAAEIDAMGEGGVGNGNGGGNGGKKKKKKGKK